MFRFAVREFTHEGWNDYGWHFLMAIGCQLSQEKGALTKRAYQCLSFRFCPWLSEADQATSGVPSSEHRLHRR